MLGILLFLQCIELFASAVFTFDDFKHILRTFPAAILQPHLNDPGKPAFEKFHVVFKEAVLEMPPGELSIIGKDLVIVVVSQFEIRFIKNRIILNMFEQF